MEIDSITLADLEVFGTSGSGGLFELIDHTTTSRGQTALRRRLQKPSSDRTTIQATQDAVRFLAGRRDLVRLSEASIESVSRYMKSNIAVGARSSFHDRLEYLWLFLRYHDLIEEIETGVSTTFRFFEQLAKLCDAIVSQQPPRLLAELTTRLRETADAVLECAALERTLLGRDRAIRSRLKSDVLASLNLLGELDALSAMAIASVSRGWVMPELVDSETFLLEAEGVHHPFVPEAVANPCRLNGGEPLVFLTGPNMAGKTTYLRSVAIVVLLAHVGMGVPAARVRVSPLDALFTGLNPADNLRAGLSYFLAEVMRVKAAARLLADNRRTLVIFDEVFKGTNVRDALDASAEVILGFAKARRSGIIFSSHLVELVERLRANSAIRFYCFDGEITDGAAGYSYELRRGVSDKRFGLLLLRQAEVPELIARIGA